MQEKDNAFAGDKGKDQPASEVGQTDEAMADATDPQAKTTCETKDEPMEDSTADTAVKAGGPASQAGIPGEDDIDDSPTDSQAGNTGDTPKAVPPIGQATTTS